MFDFKKKRLNKLELLGQGTFGEVYPYQENKGDLKWVVKYLKIKDFDHLIQCFQEIVIGSSCDHPCLVPIKGYFIEKGVSNGYNVYTKLPRMSMNLSNELKKQEERQEFYTEAQIVKYFYCLASGVEYLHKKSVFHGDIRPDNILLDNERNPKLCDFGSAKYVSEGEINNQLTLSSGAQNYKPPEVIRYERFIQEKKPEKSQSNFLNNKSLSLIDSWSLGITMLGLCCLRTRLINPSESNQQIQKSLYDIREKIERKKLYRKFLLDLIFGLLSVDPENRLQVSDVRRKLEDEFQGILTKENLGLMMNRERLRGEEIPREFSLRRYEERIEILRQENERYVDQVKELKQEIKKLEEELSNKKLESLMEELKDFGESLNKGRRDNVLTKNNATDQEVGDFPKHFVRICNEIKNLEILKIERESFTEVENERLVSFNNSNLKDDLILVRNKLCDGCKKINDSGVT